MLKRMRSSAAVIRRRFRLGVLNLLASVVLAGCATAPIPVLKPAPTTAPVAILVSDKAAMYAQVADALGTRLAPAHTYELNGDERKARDVLADLHATDTRSVVAIGSLATRAAAQLSGSAVVYCLDFARSGTPSVRSANMRGVQAVPPPFKQLTAWKMLDPSLRRVTLITGRGKESLARQARAAAQRLHIELDHLDVQSDRELLYAVKHLGPDVRGVWLAPDSRVLSAEVLREVLAYALRQGKQTLVFSSQLLRYGGLLSVEADPQDVAERVLAQLRAPQGAPRVAPLERARAVVNSEVARQLGLAVPPTMEDGLNVF
jgi:ABC-type uncharacterized transport system substrate-binding protein